MDIAVVVALAAAAADSGRQRGYVLGRRFGARALLAAGPFEPHRRRLFEAGDRFFEAHGEAAVFLGRWIVVGRLVSAWLAGAATMPWRRFAIWNALGGAAWATSIGLVAYALGTAGARWLAIVGAVGVLAMLAHLGARRSGSVACCAPSPGRLGGASPRLALGAAATGFTVFVLPAIAGAGAEWQRVRGGNVAWLSAATLAEILSYAGYVALLRTVFAGELRWRDSFLITMAGVAATRLLATAGAGGVAMTSWALHRLGLSPRRVGRGMVAFLSLLYAVYMGALMCWRRARHGDPPGGDQPLLTLLPAGLAAAVVSARACDGRSHIGTPRAAAVAAPTARPLAPAVGRLARIGGRRPGCAARSRVRRRRPAAPRGAGLVGFDIAALAAPFRRSARRLTASADAVLLPGMSATSAVPGGVGGVEGG